MEESEKGKPTAFVIMPFGQDFNEIYEHFLVSVLTESGFAVRRADNLQNAQNIIKDIVNGIAKSDLIVADLTDSNPNVYYELGLAHALNKPVILLTQELDSLPFDLKSYRVVSYTTHFTDTKRASRELASMAAGLISGETEFGSPISDFLRQAVDTISSPRQTEDIGENESGFLDHLAAMEEGWEQITQSLTEIGSELEEYNSTTRSTTAKIKDLGENPNKTSARKMRTLVMGMAQKLNDKAQSLSLQNDKYSNVLEHIRIPLEAIMRAQDPHTDEERAQLKKSLSELDDLENSVKDALAGISDLGDTLLKIPPMEKTFDRAQGRFVEQCRRLADNFEQTISMISRVKEIGDQKLNQSPNSYS